VEGCPQLTDSSGQIWGLKFPGPNDIEIQHFCYEIKGLLPSSQKPPMSKATYQREEANFFDNILNDFTKALPEGDNDHN
jgi:hypothetical protein